MIERAIENWLTSVNERHYQLPFCQTLIQKGHRVIYISRHSVMEQGKDIISLDPQGNCCAYQLKTGRIDLPEWRKIRGEIKELIELPVDHPSVDKTRIHKSFLVTNGDITDPVRLQITQMNEDNIRKGRNYSYLDVVNFSTLLREFIDAQGRVIPSEPEDFQAFLQLFLSDGIDFFDKRRYFDFITKSVLDETLKNRTDILTSISSSIVITGYLLRPFQSSGNYYAQFEAWVSLWACILSFVSRVHLDSNGWKDSLSVVRRATEESLDWLRTESLEKKDFLEGSLIGDGGDVYRARFTIVLGALCAFELYTRYAGPNSTARKDILPTLLGNRDKLLSWGESAFPFFFNIVQYLEDVGEERDAEALITTLMRGILDRNASGSMGAFPNPYYAVQDVLYSSLGFGLEEDAIDLRQFAGSSYALAVILQMLARRNRRESPQTAWRNISRFLFEEFVFDQDADVFTWRAKSGRTVSRQPSITQSWLKLVEQSGQMEDVPTLYLDNRDFLRLWLLVAPHRANANTIKVLDMKRAGSGRGLEQDT